MPMRPWVPGTSRLILRASRLTWPITDDTRLIPPPSPQKKTVSTIATMAFRQTTPANEQTEKKTRYMKTNRGMHHHSEPIQRSNRQPAISHMPVTKYRALNAMNAPPPRTFVRNTPERHTGLLSSRSIEPGSKVWVIIGAVTSTAASTPKVPISRFITAATTPRIRVFSWGRVKGRLSNGVQTRYETLVAFELSALMVPGREASISSRCSRSRFALSSCSTPVEVSVFASSGRLPGGQASAV